MQVPSTVWRGGGATSAGQSPQGLSGGRFGVSVAQGMTYLSSGDLVNKQFFHMLYQKNNSS